jgi:hypothetical protein
MSINTVAVGTSNTTVYTSTNSSAITNLTLCNYSASNVTISLHVVPSGDTVTNTNFMLKDLPLTAGDTYILYSGSEKLLFDNGDFVSVICSAGLSVTVITSYTEI